MSWCDDGIQEKYSFGVGNYFIIPDGPWKCIQTFVEGEDAIADMQGERA
jgi:hypothetical protein